RARRGGSSETGSPSSSSGIRAMRKTLRRLLERLRAARRRDRTGGRVRGSGPLAATSTLRAAVAPGRRRLVAGVAFALITITACVLVGERLTRSSWPLAHARSLPVAVATVCYFASFV